MKTHLKIYKLITIIMDSPVSKYNTRSKSKKDEEEKRKLKNDESSDDSYDSDLDSDYDDEVGMDEDEGMDRLEFRKFLNRIFPSKHLQNSIIKGEELFGKKDDEDDEDNEDAQNDEDDKESDKKDKKEKKKEDKKKSKKKKEDKKKSNKKKEESEQEEESQEESEDMDEESSEYDSDDDYEDENGTFNIVFTIKGDDYDDDDEDYETEDSDDETESEKEESESEEERPKKKRRKVKKQENKKITKKDKKNKKDKKSENKTENKSENKTSKKDDIDDKSLEAIKELVSIFKEKKGESSKEVFASMEKYIEQEQKKIDEKKKKEDKKTKIKNTGELRKLLRTKDVMNDFKFFKEMPIEEQKKIIDKVKEMDKYVNVEKPYRLKLIDSPIPAKYKANAFRKINSLTYMDPGSGEYYKVKQWVDTFMQVPFGIYHKLPITISDGVEKCNEYMRDSLAILDKAVYGMDDAKMQIMQMMGQWISNPDAVGTAIALKGPPGTGKTSIVKEGISKIMNRPFAFIALGGATDSSYLEGHSYTYEGSIWGKIVDIIIQNKCMNPVIYFDELDKVSETPKGEEIIGILTHLTDTTQNSQFHDKYFANVDFDLSKALFIFSYNDESRVNPILKDRMYRIETKGYDVKQKIIIAKNYLIPSIEKNIGFNEKEIVIDDKALTFIIKEYTDNEKGVRNFKRCLEILFTKLNLYRLMEPNTKLFEGVETFKVEFPFTITDSIVKSLIKKNKDDQWYQNLYL